MDSCLPRAEFPESSPPLSKFKKAPRSDSSETGWNQEA